MVIGGGLLAQTFKHYSHQSDVIVFASGVSNSSNTQKDQFERELTLLQHYLNQPEKLVYFSTISVYDPDLVTSPYILHKRAIEAIIKESSPNFIIFRLPILLGKSPNPATLVNFLFNSIINGRTISIYDKACRYLIDVDDLEVLLTKMIDSDQFDNQIIDVNFNNAAKISTLISILESITRKTAITQTVEKGGCYTTNNNSFISFAQSMNMIPNENYLAERIAKYYLSR